MKNNILFKILISTALALSPVLSYGKGHIQNEDVKSAADVQSVLSITGNLAASSPCIASPSSITGISAGQFAYDTTNPTFVPANTTVVGIGTGPCTSGQIKLSNNATSLATGDTFTFGGSVANLIHDDKMYVTANNINDTLSNAIRKGLVGGSGSKNFISGAANGNFEQGTTAGWSLGHSTVTSGVISGTPTFGSGADSNLSISAVGTPNNLDGSFSLQYNDTAATVAGDFLASDPLPLDQTAPNHTLTLTFAYKVSANSQNGTWTGDTGNSFGIAVYDVTNTAWIPVQNTYNITTVSGVDYAVASILVPRTTASVRYVVYNANPTAGAITMLFDDFFVGPLPSTLGTLPTPNTTQILMGSGTYTTPSDVYQIDVQMVGAGGGGGCSGTNPPTAGATNGTATTFGSSLLTANGGTGGVYANSAASVGGSIIINPPAIDLGSFVGAPSAQAIEVPFNTGAQLSGSAGGSSPLGGAGGGAASTAGGDAVGFGAGGGGGGPVGGQANNYSGQGGGAGGYIKASISNPGLSYLYSVGTGGNGGTPTANGHPGGNGANGVIIVTEHHRGTNFTVSPGIQASAVSFRATNTVAPTATIGSALPDFSAATDINFGSAQEDPQGIYSNGVVTIPSAGEYFFSAQSAVFTNGSFGDAVGTAILQNGTVVNTGYWRYTQGAAATEPVAYIPTTVGFGSPTGISVTSQRVGNKLKVNGAFQSGVSTGALASISIGFNGVDGAGLTIASPAGITGTWAALGGSLTPDTGGMYVSGTNTVGFLIGQFTQANGTQVASNTSIVVFSFEVPIVGWSTQPTGASVATVTSAKIKCAAGDKISVRAAATLPATGFENTPNLSYFQGFKITNTVPLQVPALKPPGEVFTTAAASCPGNSIAADGSTLPTSGGTSCGGGDCVALFNAIQYTYGGAGGSFVLPNLQGIFARGAGTQTIGAVGYSISQGAYANDTYQDHSHSITDVAHNHSVNDPGHSHNLHYDSNVLTSGGPGGYSLVGPGQTSRNDGTIVARTTGISLNASGTGITSTNGSNGGFRTAGETAPASLGLLYCVAF